MDHAVLDYITRIPWTMQTTVSVVYRLATWAYLRWVPLSPLHLVIPALFILYIPFWATEKAPLEGPAPIKVVDIPEKKDEPKVTGILIKRAGPKPVPAPLRVMFSLASKNPLVRWSHLIINLALLAMTADFTVRRYLFADEDLAFARVGSTTSDSVKILIRYPGVDGGDVLKVIWRETPKSDHSSLAMWKDGPIVALHPENDWVGVAELKKLWPSTQYDYRLAYPNSTFLPYPAEPLTFRTFPDQRLAGGSNFKFIASSGVIPNFPYRPFNAPNRILGLDLLADQLYPPSTLPSYLHQLFFKSIPTSLPAPAHVTVEVPQPEAPAEPQVDGAQHIITAPSAPDPVPEADVNDIQVTATTGLTATPTPTPTSSVALKDHVEIPKAHVEETKLPTSFLLLLGDLVQYNVPYPLKPFESLFVLYRRIYASSSFRKIAERIPIYNIFTESGPQSNDDTYQIYSGQANPSSKLPTRWYDFHYADVAFFVLDTATHRTPQDDPISQWDDLKPGEKTMLGAEQLGALFSWAAKVNHTATFKFVVSPIALSAMWGSSYGENTWALYPEERAKIVDLLAYIPNVIVISGDRHEFTAIEYLDGKFWEFATGPLSSYAIPSLLTRLHPLKSKINYNTVMESEKRPKLIVKEDGTEDIAVGENGMPIIEITEVEKVEQIREEKLVQAYHEGNYKWTSFEVNTLDLEKPTVKIELSIDGVPTWSKTIVGKPVPLTTTKAIGVAITGGLKGVLDKIGLNPMAFFKSRPY